MSINYKPAGVVAYCDTRPKSKTEKRFWSVNIKCTCKNKKCSCDKSRPHCEYLAQEGFKKDLDKKAKQGELCLECGG